MSQVEERPEQTPPSTDAGDTTEIPAPLPQRRSRRRVPGVLTRPPMRGPRPERHRPARDAIAAAGRLPGPTQLSEVELGCAYDHLDDHLRPLCGPDEATDAVVYAFCCWLAAQDEAGRAAVAAVRAQREEVALAARVLERMRAKETLIGSIQAERIADLAALAPIYRRDRRDTLGTTGTFTHPDAPGGLGGPDGEGGEGAGAGFARQEEVVAAAGLADLVAELAPALGWSEYTARAQVLLAQRVVAVMPHALHRLGWGQLSMAALTATVNRLVDVDDVAAATIDEHLFGPAAAGIGLTVASLRAEVDHQVQLHDPTAATARVARKTSARRVCWAPLGDGQAKLTLIGPVTAIAGVVAKVGAAAKANHAAAAQAARDGVAVPGGGDPYAEPASPGAGAGEGEVPVDERSLGAHAFDAAVTALDAVRPQALDASSAGWAAGTSVEIRISLPALVGVDDDPGYVEGYGWVPAWLVRQQLRWGGCRLRRVLTDPVTGDLVAVDGHTYPASWLTDPDDPAPDDPGGPNPDVPDGGDGPDPDRPNADGSSADGVSAGGPAAGGPGAGSGASGPTHDHDTPTDNDSASGTPPASASASASASAWWGSRVGFFKGRPIQQLPPPPAPPADLAAHADADLDLDLGDIGDPGDVGDLVEPVGPVGPVDPCTAGACEPVEPAACPLGAIGGGPHDPPEALRRHVTALWGTSTGPGDRLPAARADLDHVTPWGHLPGQGGATCACNLDPKSRRWHRRKHAGDARTAASVPWTARWQHWRCTAGHAHWRSPLGIDHITRPRPYTDPIPMYRAWAPPSRVQLSPSAPRVVDPTRGFPETPPF